MFISAETPRHSFRGHRDEDGQAWLIFAGMSHKPGDAEAEREQYRGARGASPPSTSA